MSKADEIVKFLKAEDREIIVKINSADFGSGENKTANTINEFARKETNKQLEELQQYSYKQ